MWPNQFGAWSEQKSSNGKIYYYNKDTEVSQWAKPREWLEYDEQLQESYRLEQKKQMQYSPMAVSLPPMGFFPPPPFPFPPSMPSPQMTGFPFPLNVAQPYPSLPVPFVPPPPPPEEHQFVMPTLPYAKQTQDSPTIIRCAATGVSAASKDGSVHHSNVASPAMRKKESPFTPHPYAVPVKPVESRQSCSSKSVPSAPTSRDGLSTTAASFVMTGQNSPMKRETKEREHHSHHMINDDRNQPPIKKARDVMIPSTDWEQKPWARFYKPELAKKFREKFKLDQMDELNRVRSNSSTLEKKLIAQLNNAKLAAHRCEILGHGLILQRLEKEILQNRQEELLAGMMKKKKAHTEVEDNLKPNAFL